MRNDRVSVSSYVVATLLLAFILPVQASAENLVEAAKKEGELFIIGGANITHMRKMTKEFNRKYPFLKVRYLRKHRSSIFEAVMREHRVGVHTYDVFGTLGSNNGRLFSREGLLAQYNSPERAAILPQHKDREGFWTGMYTFVLVYALNTEKVDPKEAPRSYDEFLLPKWKGKIAIHSDEVEWYASTLQILGKEKGLKFFDGLAKHNPDFRRSKSLLMQLLCAGEFSLVIPMNFHHAALAIDKGCTAKWIGIEPLVQRSASSVGLSKHAKHPAAGKLFIDWVLSKEAQEFMQANILRQSVRSDVEPTGLLEQLKGIRVFASDYDEIFTNYEVHRKRYQKTFGIQ